MEPLSLAFPLAPDTLDWGVVAQFESDDWQFVIDNADYLAEGLGVTILLTVTSIVLGFLAGFPMGAIEVYGRGPLRSVVYGAGVVLRAIPIVVILVFMFFVAPIPFPSGQFSAWLPGIGSFSFGTSAFLAATVGLGLRSAAYQAQIFRGALQSVSGGQMEAARSVGMSKLQGIRHVVLPQALRRSIPGFQNEFTIVLKDTSIAIAIGLTELFKRADDLFVQQTTATLELFLAISLVYFVMTFATNRTLDFLGDYYAIPGGDR
ncbi:amino acid ABC transporter permease [Halomarina salina]|uniref:Amino acid ABC transporter permease n=1 Tax=Halomarina salina TaxID=1872699 RepID=A0ABD5RMX3_9EURY|nr:amino acid ABC transporter permease [Halomarina salina]